MHDLLRDPLIRVRLDSGITERMSLPGIYAALVEDRVAAFPALRPHQRHAWHAFLVQLAVIVLHRAGRRTPPTEVEQWRELLQNLTSDWEAGEPWQLVVEDPRQPAFMQTPAPNELKSYLGRKETPDELDLLVTSKNHDLKQQIANRGNPEDWVLALISLQTMAGFMGRGNYGVARMNGGFSSRPCLGLAPDEGGLGAHIFFDVDRMLQGRDQVLEDFSDYYKSDDGLALLWTKPWDGKSGISLRDLDPYFLEICRRVRLVGENGRIAARTAPSSVARVSAKEAKEAKGNLGDFWTPVKETDAAALSISHVGFRYDRLADLVLHERKVFKLPPAMKVPAGASGRWKLVARGMAAGQGKTDGYHQRTDVAFNGQTARTLFGGSNVSTLPKFAADLIKEIREVQSALRFGVAVVASGGKGPDDLTKSDREHAYPYARRLDGVADKCFFPELQDRFLAADAERHVVRAKFAKLLIDEARKLLQEAVGAVPGSAIFGHRTRVRAVRAFEGRLRRNDSVFSNQPEIFGTKEEGHD